MKAKATPKFKWKVRDVFNIFVSTFLIELFLFIFLNVVNIRGLILSVNDIPVLRGLLLFGVYLLQVAGMLIPLWYFVIRKYNATHLDFGFKWIGNVRTLLWVLGTYIFYVGLGIITIMTFYSLGIVDLGFEPQSSLFEIFGYDYAGFTFAFVIAIVIAPFVEEIFFRGFILQTLMKRISVFWGVVLTALIFATVYFEFQSIMPLIILSVILNLLYVKTGSIWPGIIFHIFNNSMAFIMMLLIDNGYLL